MTADSTSRSMTNQHGIGTADEIAAGDISPAQFFFEIGYGACWAEAFVRAGSVAPFPLTDAMVERAWEISGEVHDDPAEFDRHLALANAAPDLFEALRTLRDFGCPVCSGDCGSANPPVASCPMQIASAALAKVTAA